MKTIFRFLSLAILASGVIAVGNTTSFAQDGCTDTDGQTALYTKFTGLYPKTDLESRKAALDSAKQFVEKYGNCDTVKEQNDYFKKAIPAIEEAIRKQEGAAARSAILTRFDSGIKSKNWDEVYAAGGEFLTKFPDDPARINVLVVLGTIGGRETLNKNYKYNNDATRYANEALNAFKSGVKSTKSGGTYGAFDFECAKDDCVSVLTYGVGTMSYFGGNKQAGLPYIYQATQLPGYNQKNPAVYGIIGDYYFDSVSKLGEDIAKKIQDAKALTDPEAQKKADADIKASIAMFNGYAERAMDAYARAYSLVDDKTPASKTYKDNIYKTIQALYKRRFDKDTGVNEYITAAVAKPLPDPTSPVAPIADPDPTTSTSGSTSSATVPTPTPATTTKPAPATTKPAATKPAANPIKPSSSNGTGSTTKAGAATAATKSKTTTTRKPGTN